MAFQVVKKVASRSTNLSKKSVLVTAEDIAILSALSLLSCSSGRQALFVDCSQLIATTTNAARKTPPGLSAHAPAARVQSPEYSSLANSIPLVSILSLACQCYSFTWVPSNLFQFIIFISLVIDRKTIASSASIRYTFGKSNGNCRRIAVNKVENKMALFFTALTQKRGYWLSSNFFFYGKAPIC